MAMIVWASPFFSTYIRRLLPAAPGLLTTIMAGPAASPLHDIGYQAAMRSMTSPGVL